MKKNKDIEGMNKYREKCARLMDKILKHYDSDAFLTKPSFEKLIDEVTKETK
jgi:Txe/YoeB family toxin of Txe-Axe toxin-antitoxin module|tara:strand:- start:578 stop:733 length:156 start_codon:yes stop_codon:yes gene_type:complete